MFNNQQILFLLLVKCFSLCRNALLYLLVILGNNDFLYSLNKLKILLYQGKLLSLILILIDIKVVNYFKKMFVNLYILFQFVLNLLHFLLYFLIFLLTPLIMHINQWLLQLENFDSGAKQIFLHFQIVFLRFLESFQ